MSEFTFAQPKLIMNGKIHLNFNFFGYHGNMIDIFLILNHSSYILTLIEHTPSINILEVIVFQLVLMHFPMKLGQRSTDVQHCKYSVITKRMTGGQLMHFQKP